MKTNYRDSEYLSICSLKKLKEQGKLEVDQTTGTYRVPVAVFNVMRLPFSTAIYTVSDSVLENILQNLNSRQVLVEHGVDGHSRYRGMRPYEVFRDDIFTAIGSLSNFKSEQIDNAIVITADFLPITSSNKLFSQIYNNLNDFTRFGPVGECGALTDSWIFIDIKRFTLIHTDCIDSFKMTNQLKEHYGIDLEETACI